MIGWKWVLLGIAVAGVGSFEAVRSSPLAPYVNAQMIVCALLYLFFTPRVQRQQDFSPQIKASLRGGLVLLAISVGFVIATQAILYFALKLPLATWDFYTFYKPIFHETVARQGAPLTITLFFVMLLILAPIGEELFYRGLLMRELKPWGQMAVFTIPALLFGLRHAAQLTYFWPDYPIGVGLSYTAFAFLIGLYLARLHEKTGSLVPCIIAHFVLNLVLAPVGLLIFYGLIGHV